MQRYINIPDSFINFDISPFVGAQNTVQFTLHSKGKFPFDAGLLADQITLHGKMLDKMPSYANVHALCTPRSFEQASSENIARLKARLLKGESLLDLSGGLGVDDWAFSKSFQEVTSLDKDWDLNKIARKNFEKLNCPNITRLDADAYAFVDNCHRKFDAVYLDADRRTAGGRSVLFKDTEPDILRIKDKLFTFCDSVWLKVSPMYDLSRMITELETVSNIWVLAERNEVKELLVQLLPAKTTQISVGAVEIKDGAAKQYSGYWNHSQPRGYKDEGFYLIEPSVALIKAGLVSAYFEEHTIFQLAPNSYLGVSEVDIPNVMGRQFKIVHRQEFSKSDFTTYLKRADLYKANITKRNFPLEVSAIRKQYKIADGGDQYLFFTTNIHGVKLFYHAIRTP